MRYLFASTALLKLAVALSIPRSDLADGVLKLGFQVNRTKPYDVQETHQFNLTSRYLEQLYFFDLVIGTPKKSIQVFLDTGSADLALNSDYDPSQSTSAKSLDDSFDDWQTTYDMYTDIVRLGEITLENYTLGVGESSNSFLGLGTKYMEEVSEAQEYANFPLALKSSNYIERAGFSIYFEDNDPTFQHGSILFGGNHHSKYTGELVSFPYLKIPKYPAAIKIGGIRLSNGTYLPMSTNAYIDTGTDSMALPPEIAAPLQEVFAPFYDNGTIINFHESWKTTYFSFEFANLNITIPYIDFLTLDGAGGYTLQIIFTFEYIVLLGDIFIRNAYSVFNYEDEVIQIAQVNYEPTGASNITLI